MKVTLNLNYNKQTLATLVGRVTAGIKNSEDCCYFNLDSFTTEFNTSDEDKNNIINTLAKLLTDEGYKFFFTKLNNIFKQCPYRDKVINAELLYKNDKLVLSIYGNIYGFVEEKLPS